MVSIWKSRGMSLGLKVRFLRGRSQLSTFMKAYTVYARGEGVWDHCTLFPPKTNIKF